MPETVIRDMEAEDEEFVSTCSHVNESEEIDACAANRLALLRELGAHGGRFKVALVDGEHAGFAHGVPIDRSSWGPIGRDLMVIPCLCVLSEATGCGIGRALIESIERDARDAGFAGVTITGYRDIPGAEWFMPAAYFERLGYRSVDERGTEVLLWKPFRDDASPPGFLQRNHFRHAVCSSSGFRIPIYHALTACGLFAVWHRTFRRPHFSAVSTRIGGTW